MHPRVRLYGLASGNTSFARVTAGMREGLEACGELAGFVPVDRLDDDEAVYDGFGAPIGVFVGPPPLVGAMLSRGMHRRRYCLLPPNSSWMPEALVRAVRKQVTDLLGPSRFACDVLRSYAERRLVNEKGEALRTGVSLWQHGVSSAFAWKPLSPELRGKPFTAIHFASTARQRKGTAEVIQAWTNLVLRRALGSLPTLRIVLDGPEKAFADLVAQDVGIVVERPLNLPAAAMADLYRSVHVVVQPSRGEGFGLCPLEARCCGAVVVATACTGHAEYLSPLDYLCVKTGELAPIDDGPGAMAPSLRVEDVARALNNAFTLWSNPHARLYDPDMWKTWTWKNVTADWIAREEVTW